MRYDYECPNCHVVIEQNHSIAEDPIITCPECSAKMERVITGGSGFILKGWNDWSSKNIRESGARSKRGLEKESRTRERLEAHKVPKLVPNVEGERVDSWGEAAKLAKSKGYNPDTYSSLAKKKD